MIHLNRWLLLRPTPPMLTTLQCWPHVSVVDWQCFGNIHRFKRCQDLQMFWLQRMSITLPRQHLRVCPCQIWVGSGLKYDQMLCLFSGLRNWKVKTTVSLAIWFCSIALSSVQWILGILERENEQTHIGQECRLAKFLIQWMSTKLIYHFLYYYSPLFCTYIMHILYVCKDLINPCYTYMCWEVVFKFRSHSCWSYLCSE